MSGSLNSYVKNVQTSSYQIRIGTILIWWFILLQCLKVEHASIQRLNAQVEAYSKGAGLGKAKVAFFPRASRRHHEKASLEEKRLIFSQGA